jgi:hypothetical protein
MKTLQQQYQLIKEGKGNKDFFLKQARNLFPELITVNNDYKTTVHILKSKSILTEGIGGIATINPNAKPDWFKIFDANLNEAVGVKNTKEYGNQNEFDKIDTEVQKTLDNANFDNKDEKNIDNVYGQSFLMGYYTEMKDPKNAEKTVDELKDIVLKNMSKDITYYNTKASFGVKDIGYTKDVVSGGDPVAPKGKFKSSGYGDMPKAKTVKEGLNEVKKPTIDSHIKEIEKASAVAALESKISATNEAIQTRNSKLQVAESEELSEMIDQGMVKKMKNEIKQLEKYKMQCEKQLGKLGGKKTVVDNEELNEGSDNIDEKTIVSYTQNGNKSYNVTYDDGSEDIIYVSNDAWDEINNLHMNDINSKY